MTRSTNNPWLHRFAVLTALATLWLIVMGGLVTSHEAGMAVPDWPTSYGYNMFALPFKFWKGGVFYEHTHRLWASTVGFLTVILAVWLWLKDSRRWLRWLGVIAFVAVTLQGVLGGLRVVLFRDQIGIFHATLAQLFFALTCAIALFTSKWWVKTNREQLAHNRFVFPESRSLRRLFVITTVLILFQLILGATMRHQHAGLAISDFPLAHGKLWPDTSPDAIARYNQERVEVIAVNPITAFQVVLQMIHRMAAILIFIAVTACAWISVKKLKAQHPLSKLALTWLGLILIQICLGAATVLKNKAADIATMHVLVGALSLAIGSLVCIISHRYLESAQCAAALSPTGAPDDAFVSGTATAQS